jgi:DNA polymerase I-like protein with 3'-5' exonuclease and polymerase domains
VSARPVPLGQLSLMDLPTLAAKPPPASWTPPTTLPRPRGELISIDTETNDQGLAEEMGAGWAVGAGWLCGVSMSWAGGSVYVPVRHPDTECRPVDEVARWVEFLFENNTVVFFNSIYDLGWLRASGVRTFPRRMEDAQAICSMIDENWDSYSLDSCCQRAGISGKDEHLLNEAARAHGIPKKRGSYKHGLWKLPARYVGPYAEQDTSSTLDLFRAVWPELEKEKQEDAYRTEMRLVPCLVQMKERGIRIDLDNADRSRTRIRATRDETLRQIEIPGLRRATTIEDVRSTKTLASLFDHHGISYPMTPGGRDPVRNPPQPSFVKEFLETVEHPIGGLIRKSRKLDEMAEKFIGNYIMGFATRGRIHAEAHPLRNDDGGARTSRFSYSGPPLQQMPARDEEWAPLIRNCFLSEESARWNSSDYSQQEPRLAVHFAYLCKIHGAEAAVRYYAELGPKADFHTMVAQMAGIARSSAKIINLGLMYGMGLRKLASSLGLDMEAAEALMKQYHAKVPWVEGLTNFCKNRAMARGYINLLDGARRHFPFWQPRGTRGEGSFARRIAAEARWPNKALERAFCQKAMNSAVQGSAARQTKRAMVVAYEAGHLPMVQMHDELCFSVDDPRVGDEISRIMIETSPLVVPIRVDVEYGPTWGRAKYNWEDCPT